MAAETVTIDVIANFRDKMSPGIENAKRKADSLGDSFAKTQKQIDSLSKDKAMVKLGADDKASGKITGVLGKAKEFGGKIYKATLDVKDKVGGPLKTILNSAKEFGGKTFKATLSIVDKVTSPIRGIMNTIFSLKGLIAGVAGGVAASTFIAQPISQADQLETAKIGFETMFQSTTKADNMISQIQQFAARTPFETSGVISSVQQMLRAGWTEDTVISDMEKIGNAAAAAGQGTEGVQGIVMALQQMRMAGKLNSQDMMQLTNRGVKAWEYVADAMGVTIAEARQLASDGLIPVDKALQGIIDGMGEYDGMMDKMSTRTVSGIMANLKDTFDIKIVSKWGRGLADGATRGLGKLVDFLDEIDPKLQAAGTSLQELGEELSTGFFDIVEKGYTKINDILSSDEFKNADGIIPKFKILWDKAISEPFGEWWESTGYPWIVDKMTGLGRGMGSGLSSIIKGLLGFNSGDVVDDATSIGSGFAKGFLQGFDGSGVWDALKQSIKDAFTDALNIFKGNGDTSSWLSAALLGYGGFKLGKTVIGGAHALSALGPLVGSTGNSMVQGTGLLNLLASAGYSMTGGAATAGGYFGAGTAMSGGMAALAGGAGIAGGIAGAASLISGAKDLYTSIKSGDSKEKQAYGSSGAMKIGGVAAGAAIGSIFGPLGTLVGAGIGGLAGWYGGKKEIEEYERSVAEAEEETRQLKIAQEQAKYSSQSMKDAVRDLSDGTITATEFQEKFNAAVKEDKASHFGKIKLSVAEIADMAEKITFNKAKEGLDKFASAASDAETSLANLETASASMEKWVWKGSLGFKLNETDIRGYKESVENYIAYAKSYIEDKHYEFTAAVNVLLEPDAAEGVTSSADAMYASIQEQLEAAGADLTAQVNIALEDGEITADEQEIIAEAQAKVQEIVNKISQAETEAQFTTLKIKYGGGDLDAESFEKLQTELAASVENAMASYDEALEVGITGLQLQLNEGAITEDQYNEQLKQLTDGYNAKVDELAVRVESFQFDALTDTYGEQLEQALADSDFAGTTAEKVAQAMQKATADGVDVATWDKETAAKYLGLDSLEEEAAQAITDITANIAKTIPEKLAMGEDGTPVEMDLSGFVDSIKNSADTAVAEADFSSTGTAINEKISEGLSSGTDGEGTTVDASGLVSNIQTSVDTAVAEADFSSAGTGVTTGVANAITNAPFDTIQGAIDGLKSKVQSAIDTAFSTGFNTNTTVTITADYKLANPTATLTFSGGGSGTATISGSIASNATGNIVTGKQLSWVAEEGPEAIIPLVPGRRERGLELWEKAGEALGVLKHAKGGIVGSGSLLSRLRSNDDGETSVFHASSENQNPAGPIQVNMGGLTIEINTDSNSGDVIQQIKSRSTEVVNVIADMIADAVSEAYENIPLAGVD